MLKHRLVTVCQEVENATVNSDYPYEQLGEATIELIVDATSKSNTGLDYWNGTLNWFSHIFWLV